MAGLDHSVKLNLSQAVVLVVEVSTHSANVLAQILRGFGVTQVLRALTTAQAEKHLGNCLIDLVIIDPAVSDGDGYRLLHDMRRGGGENAYVPVVLVSGHVRASDVSRARDSGANFFVTKPITPNTLLQRILFVGRDRRPFVNLAEFVGPDRRVKADGPPAGVNDRRDDDRAPLHPEGDDMSDIEIDAFDAQRVMI